MSVLKFGDEIDNCSGKIVYLEDFGRDKHGARIGKWKCFCGSVVVIRNVDVINRHTKSCGCLAKQIRFNKIKNPDTIYLRNIWYRIKDRCYCSTNKSYKNYGGRGIKISDDWIHNSDKFISDIVNCLGHRPTNKYQLDRINNHGNYELENLRWADAKTNGRNKRNNVIININGENKTVSEWSEITNIPMRLILRRLRSVCSKKQLFEPTKFTNNFNEDYLKTLWKNIKTRCLNKHNKDYTRYGERGIKIYYEWENNFKLFEQWIIKNLGHKPEITYKLDRINNNGNYEPGNLRWVSNKHNCRNKSNNIFISISGESKTIAEWAEISGLGFYTIRNRYLKHWPEEKILSPIKKRKFEDKDILNIRQAFDLGATKSSLAKRYKCKVHIIIDIIFRRGAYSI